MKRLSIAAVLLLIGGLVMVVGLPLQWYSQSNPDGSAITRSGLDYAGYDIVTTVALGVALVAAAFGVAAATRWGRRLGVIAAVFACLWGALVVIAAASPADGTSSGVKVSVGIGAVAVAVGAFLGLIGGIMSLRDRGVAVVTTGVPSSV